MSSTPLPGRISLSRFLIEQQREKGHLNADLRLLIEVVARACKRISIAVGKGALGGALGRRRHAATCRARRRRSSTWSPTSCLLEANEWGGHLAALASEEMDDPHPIPHRYPKGEYLLVFDPLDGSSNIDVNISVGTIFSVLRCPDGIKDPDESSFLQPGTRQVAAGYAVYGSSTVLVLTLGDGVHQFTLDRELRRLPADAVEPAHSGGHLGVRHQHVEHAPLGSADAALHRRAAGRQDRPARAATSTCAGSPRWSPTCTAS